MDQATKTLLQGLQKEVESIQKQVPQGTPPDLPSYLQGQKDMLALVNEVAASTPEPGGKGVPQTPADVQARLREFAHPGSQP